MLFSSIVFLYYFLPITMIIYWLIPKNLKNIFVFIISLFFYAWGEPIYIFLMLISIYVNYKLGLCMHREGKNPKNILYFALIFNLGLLIFFKYTNFIVVNINRIFDLSLDQVNIKLPLGISFFTFQALSYIIDLYRREVRAQTSFMKLGLYISAYPQLVAGPIVRYSTIMDQIDERSINLEKISYGIIRFTLGLGKKVILANQFAQIADWTFAQGNAPSSALAAWLGVIAYGLQIYYDFSGYSDMAIGLGSMLGFQYEENFNYPYISKSVTEFWNRWHISLGSWFRDYLYIPLGGNKVTRSRNIFNLFLVWLMTGLWHGAEWNFVVWGLYFFLIIVVEKYIIKIEKIPNVLRHIITLLLIFISWPIFRLDSLTDSFNYILAMFNIRLGSHRLVGSHIILHDYWYLIILGVFFSTGYFERFYRFLDRENIGLILIESISLLLILLMVTMYLVNSTYNPFIYFRF